MIGINPAGNSVDMAMQRGLQAVRDHVEGVRLTNLEQSQVRSMPGEE